MATITINFLAPPQEITGALPQVANLNETDGGGADTWFWELLDRPPGSAAVIVPNNIQNPLLQSIDTEGTYLIRVTLTSGGAPTTDQAIAFVYDKIAKERVPAAGETLEGHVTRGWAEARDTYQGGATPGAMHRFIHEFGRGRCVQTCRLLTAAGPYQEGDVVDIRQDVGDPADSYTLENGDNIPFATMANTAVTGIWGLVLEDYDGAKVNIALAADATAHVLVCGLLENAVLFGGGTFGDNTLLYIDPAVPGRLMESASMYEGPLFNPGEMQPIARVIDGTTNGLVEVFLSQRYFDQDALGPKVLGPDVLTGAITLGNRPGVPPAVPETANINIICEVLAPMNLGEPVYLEAPQFGASTRVCLAMPADEGVGFHTRFGAIATVVPLPGTTLGGELYQPVCVDGFLDVTGSPVLPGGAGIGNTLCIPDAASAGTYILYPTGAAAGGHNVTARTIPMATIYSLAPDILRVHALAAFELINSWRGITSDDGTTLGPRYAGDELSITGVDNVETANTIPGVAADPGDDVKIYKRTHESIWLGVKTASLDSDGFGGSPPTVEEPACPAKNTEWDPGAAPPDATYILFPFKATQDTSALVTWDFAFVNRRYDPDEAKLLIPTDTALIWLEAGKVSDIRFDLVFYNPEDGDRQFAPTTTTDVGGLIFGSYLVWARTWETSTVPLVPPNAHGWKIESGWLGDPTMEWGGAHPTPAVMPYNNFVAKSVVLPKGFSRQGILEYDPRSPTFPSVTYPGAIGGWDLLTLTVNDDPAFYYTFALQLMASNLPAGTNCANDVGLVGLEISVIYRD